MSLVIAAIMVSVAVAQRSPYAGSRPSGYKDRFKPTQQTQPAAAVNNQIGNRFGEENSAAGNLVGAPAVTQRIPIDYWNDRGGYDILSRYPVDKQPFWLINYQAIEAHRQPIRG